MNITKILPILLAITFLACKSSPHVPHMVTGSNIPVLGEKISVSNVDYLVLVHSSNVDLPYSSRVVYRPDGQILAIAGKSFTGEGTIQFRDSRTAELIQTLSVPFEGYVQTLMFSHDGKVLISGSSGLRNIALWDGYSGKLIESLSNVNYHTDDEFVENLSLAMKQDGTCIAFSNRNWISIWDVRARKEVGRLRLRQMVGLQHAAFSPDGRLYAIAIPFGEVEIWDVEYHSQRQLLKCGDDHTISVAFSPDGRLIASSGFSGLVELWDVQTGKRTAALKGHDAPGGDDVAFSSDGALIASTGGDSAIRIWNTQSGKAEGLLLGKGTAHASLAFSPDGMTIASLDQFSNLQLWKVPAEVQAREGVAITEGETTGSEKYAGVIQQIAEDISKHYQRTGLLAARYEVRLITIPITYLTCSGYGWGGGVTAYFREGDIRVEIRDLADRKLIENRTFLGQRTTSECPSAVSYTSGTIGPIYYDEPPPGEEISSWVLEVGAKIGLR